MKTGGSTVLNSLSIGLLALTLVTLIGYLVILINPYIFFNPFPPPRRAAVSPTPFVLPTPSLPPTWTPTPTFTPLPTATPRPTRTPTSTPTATATWPPTPTPTPRVTRAPYPFTCEVIYRRPEYDHWSGVAGHFQDLDGNPLPGYRVRVQCPGVPQIFDLVAGADARFNLIYGNEAAWERSCDPTAYRMMQIQVQVWCKEPDAQGNCAPLSEPITVELGGYASASLGYVVCTLNWENWR
ncbi:MAG TPA: hypothetical protein G4O00_05055 [Thermoflexia bacterium]|nr:hypothetical protein [Thermoflexia bacterium]